MPLLPCMICDAPMVPHVTKDFAGTNGLGKVDYTRCKLCRFVQSETVFRMPEERWSALNESGHGGYQGSDVNVDDPRWLERLQTQRDVIVQLKRYGALPDALPWVDWGAGDGKLLGMLADAGLTMDNYDAYMNGPGFLDCATMKPGLFDLVISTSVFEHVRSLATLDEMEALVSPDGVFAIHTLVRDEAPADPDWFYYLATHVAMHSNDSMHRLFARWNYRSSIYHVPSRLWFWFRDTAVDAFALACRGNADAGEEHFVAAEDFVSYWR